MAQQEDGWPLNVIVSLASSNHDHSGSVSFNTMLTASPHHLPLQIQTHSILELSKRSVRGKKAEAMKENRINNGNKRSKVWVFSLCLRDNVDVVTIDVPSSLGHFLALERRAPNEYRRNHSPHQIILPTEWYPECLYN